MLASLVRPFSVKPSSPFRPRGAGRALTPDERAHAAVRKFLADRGEPVPVIEEGPDEV